MCKIITLMFPLTSQYNKIACPSEDILRTLNSKRCWDEPVYRGTIKELICSAESAGRANILAVWCGMRSVWTLAASHLPLCGRSS